MQELCERCGRKHYAPQDVETRPWCGAYVTVEHDFYGCGSGCCGHRVYLYDENGHNVDRSGFHFGHPWSSEAKEEFCKDLAEESFPGIPLRLEECDIQEGNT